MALTGTSSPPEVAAAPVALPARPPTVSDRGRSRPAVVVGALALAAALWAVAASALFVPRLTDNGDEAVYLLQAESLRAGHLFPPAAEPTRSFLPWLSTTVGHHYVTKYTPVFPAFIALGHRVFGSARAAAGGRPGLRFLGRLPPLRHPERHLPELPVQRRAPDGVRRRPPGRAPA